jgi:hypothetical protein
VIPWAPPVSQMEVPCYGNVARAPPLLIAKEQVRVERFFIEFGPFFKKRLRNEPVGNLFSSSVPFKSRQTG